MNKNIKKSNEKQKSNTHIYESLYNNKYLEELVAEVKEDFKKRQAERKPHENQWQLNMNFLLGNQYCTIAGTGDKMSGTALEILLEQDNTRLASSADQVKFAVKNIAQQLLRLYKQFTTGSRLSKLIGHDGSVEMFYFESGDISSDDIVFETQNEFGETLSQKRSLIFELLKAGLLYDENGKLSNRTRIKTLEMLGFGVWENQHDLNELHTEKAGKE